MIEVVISILIVGSLALAWSSLAPWVPTQTCDLNRIIKLMDLKEGQKFVEIGCGNGRVSSYVAKKNPKANVIGIEYAFPFYLFSKIRGFIFGPSNMKIEFGNALKKDFSDVDVVYVFGLKETVNGVLKDKMRTELKKGAKFISYVFEVDGWIGKEKKAESVEGAGEIYLYEK